MTDTAVDTIGTHLGGTYGGDDGTIIMVSYTEDAGAPARVNTALSINTATGEAVLSPRVVVEDLGDSVTMTWPGTSARGVYGPGATFYNMARGAGVHLLPVIRQLMGVPRGEAVGFAWQPGPPPMGAEVEHELGALIRWLWDQWLVDEALGGELAAKVAGERQILDLCASSYGVEGGPVPGLVIRLLAERYATRGGYFDGWRSTAR